MSWSQNWLIPGVATCFLHVAILFLPINLQETIKKQKSTVTFRLVSPSTKSPSPLIEKELPQPKRKPLINQSRPLKKKNYKARKPKASPKKIVKKQKIVTKEAPASINSNTVQPREESPAQSLSDLVSATATSVMPAKITGPITLSQGELSVVCPKMKEPVYPMISRQLGEQGQVIIELELDKKGRVIMTRIIKSSGYKRLDKAALATLNAWRCNPPLRDGQSVSAIAQQPFDFVLQED